MELNIFYSVLFEKKYFSFIPLFLFDIITVIRRYPVFPLDSD